MEEKQKGALTHHSSLFHAVPLSIFESSEHWQNRIVAKEVSWTILTCGALLCDGLTLLIGCSPPPHPTRPTGLLQFASSIGIRWLALHNFWKGWWLPARVTSPPLPEISQYSHYIWATTGKNGSCQDVTTEWKCCHSHLGEQKQNELINGKEKPLCC